LGANKNQKDFLKDLFGHHATDETPKKVKSMKAGKGGRSGSMKIGHFDEKYQNIEQNSSRLSLGIDTNSNRIEMTGHKASDGNYVGLPDGGDEDYKFSRNSRSKTTYTKEKENAMACRHKESVKAQNFVDNEKDYPYTDKF
jgi:hypothetical protein